MHILAPDAIGAMPSFEITNAGLGSIFLVDVAFRLKLMLTMSE